MPVTPAQVLQAEIGPILDSLVEDIDETLLAGGHRVECPCRNDERVHAAIIEMYELAGWEVLYNECGVEDGRVVHDFTFYERMVTE